SQLNLVLSLTVSFAVAAGVLGLYRSEAVGAFHSLWIKALLATILGLLLTTLLPATFRRNFGNLPGGGVAVLAVWLGCLLATRFAFTVVIRRRLFLRRIVVVASQDCAERFE